MSERRSPIGTMPEITHIPIEQGSEIGHWTEWGDVPESPLVPGFLNMTHRVVEEVFERIPRGRLYTAFQTDRTGKNMVFISRTTGEETPSMQNLVGYFEANPMPAGERRGNASPHYDRIAFMGVRTGGRAMGTENGLVYIDYGPINGDDISTYVLRTVMSSGRHPQNSALSDDTLRQKEWDKQDLQDPISSDDPLSSIELPDDLGRIQIPTSIVLGSSSMR